MHCKSTSTIKMDGYRAGAEIADGLADLEPEVILLFASTNYQPQFEDVFAALYDALPDQKTIIFGGTCDGIYETERVANYGITAMGLNSGGQLKWNVTVEQGVEADSLGAARRCAERDAAEAGSPADFVLALADAIRADGSAIVAGLSTVLSIPFAGALVGDDRKFESGLVLLNGEVYENAVALLSARGPIKYVINAASGFLPQGNAGQVEAAQGRTLERISGNTAQAFIRQQIGKTPGETDMGYVPIAAYDSPDSEHFFLRSPAAFDAETGAITMFGSVTENATVRVCTATTDQVLDAVKSVMAPLLTDTFTPSGALMISCAGRRWLLEERNPEEVERILAALGSPVPLIGLPSFGEIGPFRASDGSYSPTFFHNATLVICLFE